jgi:hypothetical protein
VKESAVAKRPASRRVSAVIALNNISVSKLPPPLSNVDNINSPAFCLSASESPLAISNPCRAASLARSGSSAISLESRLTTSEEPVVAIAVRLALSIFCTKVRTLQARDFALVNVGIQRRLSRFSRSASSRSRCRRAADCTNDANGKADIGVVIEQRS